MESALLKLPATPSTEPNGRQAHLFLALVPGTAALGEGPRSWGKDPEAGGYLGGSQSLSAPWRESPVQARPRPAEGPRARSHRPRAALTCGAEPQAGAASPSCHACCRRAAKATEKNQTPAAAACAPGKGSCPCARGREAWHGGRGRGRPASATLPGPRRPPPLSMRGIVAHAWNWGACAVVPTNFVRFPLPSGAWEPSKWALSCGGRAVCVVGGRFREVRYQINLEGKVT